MGDESKKSQVESGQPNPLAAPLKPTSADAVDPEVSDVVQIPATEESRRRVKDVNGRPKRKR